MVGHDHHNGAELMKNLVRLLVLAFMSVSFSQISLAEETSCAVVQIEIKQELTLERQAFDARMKITNSLDTAALDNVRVDVAFTDEDGNPVLATNDPNSEGASFYIRLDDQATTGITAVDGTESIAASSVADIHWLIIPVPGSGGEVPSGKLYYVGAKLTYSLAGEEKEVEVSPDAIYVKPLPKLELDYFLTQHVHADDPMTDPIEPIEPFTLGVRIRNNGNGPGNNIKIDSAQPQIVEYGNQQGLLIGFEITSSYLNDNPVEDTLLIDFGDIEAGKSKIGRWVMQTTLSGTFTAFEAEFTHADELGGNLTSIIEMDAEEAAHLLIKDVIVDLPGRDSVKDFLAQDDAVIRVYESDSVDTEVTYYSAPTSFSHQGVNGPDAIYALQVPATDGALYTKVADPFYRAKIIKSVIRQDGKVIPLDNAWLSKERAGEGEWNYFFNLFDVNSEGEYTVIFTDSAIQSHAPVIQFIPQKTVEEGSHLGILVEATDQDGTIPTITLDNLPTGATFTDLGNGTGEFSWTPQLLQKGRYQVIARATDGEHTAQRTITIQVNTIGDADGDGIADEWENDNFGNLDKDGSDDTDGDGYSDLEEYINNTNPNLPETPVILEPANMSHSKITKPTIVIQGVDTDSEQMVSYAYEIYSDEGMTILVDSGSFVSRVADQVAHQLAESLEDNAWYYLRVKVSSKQGSLFSSWTESRFFINETNNAPDPFTQSLPEHGATVTTYYPQLQVNNSQDQDGDEITYIFEVYDDEYMTTNIVTSEPVLAGGDGTTEWDVSQKLENDRNYFWRALAMDSHGSWTPTTLRILRTEVANTAPPVPELIMPLYNATSTQQVVTIQVTKVEDIDEDEINYYFQLDKVNTFDSPSLIESDAIEPKESAENIEWIVPSQVPGEMLDDNTMYYWRVRVEDSNQASSNWAQSKFFVNTVNDTPTVPTIANPGDQSWVEDITPRLEVNTSTDLDNDPITYEFEVKSAILDYETGTLMAITQIESAETSEVFWEVEDAGGVMSDNEWYAWRARAKDTNSAASNWTDYSYFFTDSDGINDTPTIAISFDDSANPGQNVNPDVLNMVTVNWTAEDPDNVATIALYYDIDQSGEDGILITEGIYEIPDNSTYDWDTSGMEPGVYYIYAVITDGNTSTTSYTTNAMEILGDTVVIFDNKSPEASMTGSWSESTWYSGFYDTDYYVSSLIWAPGAEGIIIDNSDPGFSFNGNWEIDTRFNDGLRPPQNGDFISIHPLQPAASAIVVDNNDPNNFVATGNWELRDGMGYAGNILSHTRGDGDGQAVWSFDVYQSGRHKVYVSWEKIPEDRLESTFIINAIDGEHSIYINQWRSGKTSGDEPARRRWHLLGEYDFNSGTTGSVVLNSNTSASVVADAIYVEHVDATPNQVKWVPNIPEAGRYQVHAWYPRAERESEYAEGVKYTIEDANQEKHEVLRGHYRNGGEWANLGTYDFAAGELGSVTMSDDTNVGTIYTQEKMFADALKFIKVSDEPSVFTWAVTLPVSGQYNLYTRWPYDCGATTKAKYLIESDAGVEEVLFKQNCRGSDWYLIGTFDYTQGTNYQISISDEFADGRTYADAIKLERLEEQSQ